LNFKLKRSGGFGCSASLDADRTAGLAGNNGTGKMDAIGDPPQGRMRAGFPSIDKRSGNDVILRISPIKNGVFADARRSFGGNGFGISIFLNAVVIGVEP
jgi:hypothetical protein